MLDQKVSGSEERIRARNEKKILKTAVQLFSRKGFDGTRIAEIAELSGLPKANVYYYFSTKEAIYTTLIESLLAGWDRALEHITADRDTTRCACRLCQGKTRLFAQACG